MFPFDRLIGAVDQIAAARPQEAFMAQIGRSTMRPAHMRFETIMPAAAFGQTIDEARLVVAHAGMGTIITALQAGKPIVVLPRRAELGEVTTNHQLATAKWLRDKRGVFVAEAEADLAETIDRALSQGADVDSVGSSAPPEFIAKIRGFILGASA